MPKHFVFDMGMGKICPVSIKIAVMLVFIAIEIY